MTAAAIATMATVDAARIIVPVFSVPLLLNGGGDRVGAKLGPPANSMSPDLWSGARIARAADHLIASAIRAHI
jgi:hypothetical protein